MVGLLLEARELVSGRHGNHLEPTKHLPPASLQHRLSTWYAQIVKKALLLTAYLVCGYLLTLGSQIVKAEQVTEGQICWPNSDNCQPFDNRVITRGFPLKYKEDIGGSVGLTPPTLYSYKFAFDVLFWALVVAASHRYVSKRMRPRH